MAPTPSDQHEPVDEPEHHDGLRERLDDFVHRVEEAAIEAEFETGEREETIEEAKAHALVRAGRMTLGFLVVIIGIVALPLPGPGWLIIAAGLTILSRDVAWAERLLRYIRKRVPGIPEDGRIPASSLATMGVITLSFVSASMWWTFGRGSDEIQVGTYAVTELVEPTGSVPAVDPGIEIDLTETGPVTLKVSGCDPIDFEVLDRSKTSFDLARPGDSDWDCSNPEAGRLVAGMAESELRLDYTTDGIVDWFLADDRLSTISIGDGDGDVTFELAID